jgi:crossover junction endodeoxyribonuclease RusA
MNKVRSFGFSVFGIPKPGGSKRAFVIPGKNGANPRANVVEDCKKNKEWRESVKSAFLHFNRHGECPLPYSGPVEIRVCFMMPRPKSHYRTGKHAGLLKESAPQYHTKKPDVTKLMRSTEDALTGLVWRDDSQIYKQEIKKIYAESPGAFISVVFYEAAK